MNNRLFVLISFSIVLIAFGGIWHNTLASDLPVEIQSANLQTQTVVSSDYYYFALSRALPQKILFRRYILPNLMPPVITLLGLSLPGLIGGSVILEQIFGIEGMGQLFYLSALSRDYPVIMGILMITSFLTLLGNMFADLILLKLNPYTKRG